MMNCLVVDDEPIARQILENYIGQVPHLALVKSCGNAFEAIEYLSTNPIDIMFLDINMPKLSGLNLLKTIKIKPFVILTTAYSEYAVEGFELSVTDYLLKPFSFERFLQAVLKVPSAEKSEKQINASKEVAKYIFVKSEKTLLKLDFDDIMYVEAYGNYLKIHCQKVLLTPQTLSTFYEQLPTNFIRIHKSFIINFDALKGVEGNQVIMKNEVRLPIGKSYKSDVFNRMRNS